MLRVAIVVEPFTLAAMATGTMDLLRSTAQHTARLGRGQPAFSATFVGARHTMEVTSGAQLPCTTTYANRDKYDVVIVPGFEMGFEERITCPLPAGAVMPGWLAAQAEGGARVLGLCSGAFGLAAAGLLLGKRAALHWAFADAFARAYPEIEQVHGQLIVDNGSTLCGGGATSFLQVLLYWVGQTFGPELRNWTAKVFLIEPDRHSQLHFRVFVPELAHGDEAMLRCQQRMHANVGTTHSLSDLASEALLGERQFARRFKAATGHTPLAYLQAARMDAAAQALERPNSRVGEVASTVGYQDEKAFRSKFKEHTGLSPMAYRAKYAVRVG